MNKRKIIRRLRRNGVIISSSDNVYIESSAVIERGVVIEDNVHILGNSIIGKGTHIGSGTYLLNATLGSNVNISNSKIENAYIGDNTSVGPYAHIHKDSHIGCNVRVGNFVEIKNSNIGDGSKMAHLAYIGDVDMGKECNIGCGAIFVNYDGVRKRRSKVGNRVFIGSNSNVIAPVSIEDGAYLAAGSTLTIDLKSRDLCIARAREVVKENRSKYKREL